MAANTTYFNRTSKPYVRWWRLAGPFSEGDTVSQLDWLKANGFGGVELAWIRPVWLQSRVVLEPRWLSREWLRLTAFTKQYADEIGVGSKYSAEVQHPAAHGLRQPMLCLFLQHHR